MLSPFLSNGAGMYIVLVGPIPDQRPMLKSLTKTTPRLPSPQLVVVIYVSVGSLERLNVALVKVGQMAVDSGAGELFQFDKLIIIGLIITIIILEKIKVLTFESKLW